VRLKYEELYYRYRQKVDLLTALKQQPGEELPDEADALSDFFAFLRAGGVGVNKEDQVLIVANSLDMLAFLHQKALPQDLAMIAGELRKKTQKTLTIGPWTNIAKSHYFDEVLVLVETRKKLLRILLSYCTTVLRIQAILDRIRIPIRHLKETRSGSDL
jgi:hypothetical protein